MFFVVIVVKNAENEIRMLKFGGGQWQKMTQKFAKS
jgi:hypothetical protein